jgi:hypothetical protein
VSTISDRKRNFGDALTTLNIYEISSSVGSFNFYLWLTCIDILSGYYDFRPEKIVLLADNRANPERQPTRRNIIDAMKWLVKDAQPDDSLFFSCKFIHIPQFLGISGFGRFWARWTNTRFRRRRN